MIFLKILQRGVCTELARSLAANFISENILAGNYLSAIRAPASDLDRTFQIRYLCIFKFEGRGDFLFWNFQVNLTRNSESTSKMMSVSCIGFNETLRIGRVIEF